MKSVLVSLAPDVRPRLPALTRLVARYSKRSDPAKALAVYDSLDVLGIAADNIMAYAAVEACRKWNRGRKAAQIIVELSGRGLCCSASTYARAICAVSKTQHAHLSVEVRQLLAKSTCTDLLSVRHASDSCTGSGA